MKTRIPAAIAVLIALAPAAASATQWGKQTMNAWKSADSCTKIAQQAFPDYTPASNAKRDAALRSCLAGGILAPREPLSLPAGAK